MKELINDPSGRQRNASSSTLPSSSSFRRLPNLGRGTFRRGEKGSSPSPDDNPSSGGETPSHQRTATIPPVLKASSDDNPGSSSHLPASMSAFHIAANGQGHFSEGEDSDPNSSSHLFPPSRTSSLPQIPSSHANPDSLSIQSSQAFPVNADDLVPITYPVHLAQTRPPDISSSSAGHAIRPSIRDRDLTMGSGATILLGAVHSVPSRGEPSTGDPVLSVPRRKDMISPSNVYGEAIGGDFVEENEENENSAVVEGDGRSKMHTKAESSEVLGMGSDHQYERSTGPEETPQRQHEGAVRAPMKSANTKPDDKDDIRGDRMRSRSRKTSAKALVGPDKPHQPILPSARGIARVPASAMYFSLLPFHGTPPGQALRAHTGTLVGERIWFIGGVDAKNCWRGVAWFDTETLLWSRVDFFGEQLPPLRAHTTNLVGTRLFIFGGGDGPTYSNDVWIFDTSMLVEEIAI